MGVNFVLFFQIIPLHTTSHPKSTLYTFYKFSGSSIMCWVKIWHIYFNRSIAMVSVHCELWGDFSTHWKYKKAKCFLCLMAQDRLPSLRAEFLPLGASCPNSRGSSSHLLHDEFFSFCGYIQHSRLSIIDLCCSHKQSITDDVEQHDLAWSKT